MRFVVIPLRALRVLGSSAYVQWTHQSIEIGSMTPFFSHRLTIP